MSKFSEKCKELLTENGYNVYRLSQAASLERTTLQRMVTGKRLPGPEFVEHFCQALRISLPEKKEIMELYKMEAIGETAYRNQTTILHLFEKLSALEKNEGFNKRSIVENGRTGFRRLRKDIVAVANYRSTTDDGYRFVGR